MKRAAICAVLLCLLVTACHKETPVEKVETLYRKVYKIITMNNTMVAYKFLDNYVKNNLMLIKTTFQEAEQQYNALPETEQEAYRRDLAARIRPYLPTLLQFERRMMENRVFGNKILKVTTHLEPDFIMDIHLEYQQY